MLWQMQHVWTWGGHLHSWLVGLNLQLRHRSPFHLSYACGSFWPSLTPSTEHAAGPVTQRFQPLGGFSKVKSSAPSSFRPWKPSVHHSLWGTECGTSLMLLFVSSTPDPCSRWDPLTGAVMVLQLQLCHLGCALWHLGAATCKLLV